MREVRYQLRRWSGNYRSRSHTHYTDSSFPTLYRIDVCQRAVQLPLIHSALQDGADAQQELGLVNGFGQEIVCARLNRALDVTWLIQGSDHQYSNIVCDRVRAQPLAHLETTDLGHHDIQQDQIRMPLLDFAKRFIAV